MSLLVLGSSATAARALAVGVATDEVHQASTPEDDDEDRGDYPHDDACVFHLPKPSFRPQQSVRTCAGRTLAGLSRQGEASRQSDGEGGGSSLLPTSYS